MSQFITRDEAYEAMCKGKCVKHASFVKGEYLRMLNGVIRDEQGCNFEEGWKMRRGFDLFGCNWDIAWSIVNDR